MTLARLHAVSKKEMMLKLGPFLAQVSALREVEEVILFGSLARGQMTEASDIDLAVLLEENADLRKMKEEIRRLKRLHLSWPCDLVVGKRSWYESRKLFGGICMEIAVSGETLYKKSQSGENHEP